MAKSEKKFSDFALYNIKSYSLFPATPAVPLPVVSNSFVAAVPRIFPAPDPSVVIYQEPDD